MNISEISKSLEKHRRVLIPKVPKAVVKELAKIIKPVVEENGKLYYIKPVDLYNVAYTWDYKIDIEAEGLLLDRSIKTYHSCSYYGFFKPSIAEVLCQIPHWKHVLDNVYAFRIDSKTVEYNDDNECHEVNTYLYNKIDDVIGKDHYTLMSHDS